MKRLLSLDVMRGLTVALMILVNNGAGHEHFHQLTHSKWNGLTVCDLVFPFFLFMVGVSISFSLSKYSAEGMTQKWDERKDVIGKILVRGMKMFVIGVLLHAWDMWVGGKEDIIGNLRLWGVLERIALCYVAASMLVLFVKARYFYPIIGGLIAGYCLVLTLGNGYAQDETNIACIIDRLIIGQTHLYHKSPIDPEGLLGTLPAIAHTMIGVVVGRTIRRKEDLEKRLKKILLMAGMLLITGLLMSLVYPLNKRIWSPSYVMVTCGIGSMLLVGLTAVIDLPLQKGKGEGLKWYRPCQWFGMNAIVLYVVSEMLAPVMGRLGVGDMMYEGLQTWGFTAEWASVTYAISFVMGMTLIAWVMYRKKVFVKL